MKLNSTLCILVSILMLPAVLCAQSTGDYRSHASGTSDWHNTRTWQVYNGASWIAATAPPSETTKNVTISKGDSITLTHNAVLNHIDVQSGGILSIYNINDSMNFVLNHVSDQADVVVNGRLYLSDHANLYGTGWIDVPQGGLMVFRRTGVLQVPVVIEASALLIIDQDPCLKSTITNNGLIHWPTSGNLRMEGGTLINNGVFSIDAPVNMFITNTSGTNLVVNNASGVIIKTNNTAALSINAKLENYGLIKGVGPYALNNMTGDGIINPGDSVGILSLNAQSFRKNTTKIAIDMLDGTGPGKGYDRLEVRETYTTDLSHTSLQIIDHGNVPAGTYTIMTTTGSFTGSFASTSIPQGYSHLSITAKAVTIQKDKLIPDFDWYDFTVEGKNNQTFLKWSTSKEGNITTYNVERSIDSINFYSIGIVKAKGNSVSLTTYSYTDISPLLNRTNYYRIKAISSIGFYDYSDIRKVDFYQDEPVKVMPNPVRTTLRFSVFPDQASARIYSSAGVLVKTLVLKQGYNDIDVQALSSGTYFINIYVQDKIVETKKIIKLR